MNGLALQLQQALQRDPHAGDLYVFRGKRGDLVKNAYPARWHLCLNLAVTTAPGLISNDIRTL